MLNINHIHKRYRKSEVVVRALDDVTLEVKEGEFVVVQGPSGCGKTTLLLTAGGLLSPDDGDVLLEGEDFYRLSVEARARLRASAVGFVFQQFHLIPYLSVLENVMCPSLAVDTAHSRTRPEELIAHFGLSDRARHLPSELSTGERQRTALARALLNRPRLLLADEPTGNLDPASSTIGLEHLAEFARSGGAVLLATHDTNIKAHASRILRIVDGKMVGRNIDD